MPWDATTGSLVITSQNYGSDSSLDEALCCGEGCSVGENWPGNGNPEGEDQICGNDLIAGNFVVTSPNNPAFILSPESPGCNSSVPCYHTLGTQFSPQYIEGSWFYNDGGEERFFTLTQGPQDSKTGVWTITGTEWSSFNGGPYPIKAGLMDASGDVMLETATTNTCLEFQILGSGDVTSPIYSNLSGGFACPAPEKNFLLYNFAEADEGPYWYFVAPPLFKSQTSEPPFVSQTDVPPLETPTFYQWVAYDGYTLETAGQWTRTDLGSPDLTGCLRAGLFTSSRAGWPPTAVTSRACRVCPTK